MFRRVLVEERLSVADSAVGVHAAWSDDVIGRLIAGRSLSAVAIGSPGSGRSALLRHVASRIADHNVPLHIGLPPPGATHPVAPHDRPIVLIADDVHLWPEHRIEEILELVDDGRVALVAATEPRDSAPGVRHVISRARRSQAVLTLGPLSTSDVLASAHRARVAITPPVAARIRRSCAGSRECVDAVLAALAQSALSQSGTRTVTTDLGSERSMEVIGRISRDHHHRLLRGLDAATRDVLALAMLGAPLDPDSVAAILHIDIDCATDIVDAARGTGLVGGSDTFASAAADPLRGLVGAARIADLRLAAAVRRLAADDIGIDDALLAADAGITDPRLLPILLDAATTAEVAEPIRAATLLTAAGRLAPGRVDIELRSAYLALGAGDVDGVGELADRRLEEAAVVDSPTKADTGSDVAQWASLAASVATIRGRRHQAANIFRWLTSVRGISGACAAADLDHHVVAVLALLGDGDVAPATAIAAAAADGPPTAGRLARVQVMDGLIASTPDMLVSALPIAVSHHPVRRDIISAAVSLAILSGDRRAARAVIDAGRSVRVTDTLLPEASLALLAGELTDPVVQQAIDIGTDSAALGAIGTFWAHALRLGVARRAGDSGALSAAWEAASATLTTVDPDLFTLLPLIEFWLAAAHLDDLDAVKRAVSATDRILRRLDAPIWSSAWEFAGVQAAVIAGDHDACADRLARATSFAAHQGSPAEWAVGARGFAELMTPAPTMTTQTIDATVVTAGVAALSRIGMPVEAAQLAGLAAQRSDDAASTTELLQTARRVQSPNGTGPEGSSAPAGGPLSGREADVAVELVAGYTYREIGERLFISPRTVEHHVARIRSRLDVRSRSQLMSALRAAGYG